MNPIATSSVVIFKRLSFFVMPQRRYRIIHLFIQTHLFVDGIRLNKLFQMAFLNRANQAQSNPIGYLEKRYLPVYLNDIDNHKTRGQVNKKNTKIHILSGYLTFVFQHSQFFMFRNRKKSLGAKSGEYGGFGNNSNFNSCNFAIAISHNIHYSFFF